MLPALPAGGLPPPGPGGRADCDELVLVVVVLWFVVVPCALAKAAPPPTSAPVAARVITTGFNRIEFHLLSHSTAHTIADVCRSDVGMP
jgi:hypothetical protein